MAYYLYPWPAVHQQPYNVYQDYYYPHPAKRAPAAPLQRNGTNGATAGPSSLSRNPPPATTTNGGANNAAATATANAQKTRRVHFVDDAPPLSPHRRPVFWPPQTPYTAPGHWSSPGSTVPLPPLNAPPLPPSPYLAPAPQPPSQPLPISPYHAPMNGFSYPAPYYTPAYAYQPYQPMSPISPTLSTLSPALAASPYLPPPGLPPPPSPYMSTQQPLPPWPVPAHHHAPARTTTLPPNRIYADPSYPVIPDPAASSRWQGNSYVSPNAGLLFSLPPSRDQLHPLLSGEGIRLEAVLDFSFPEFRPMRLTGPPSAPHPVPMSEDDFFQVASQPPLPSLTIICPALGENWRVDVSPPAGRCVTIGDVYHALYERLRLQIDHAEWGALSPARRVEVTKAYTKRCKRGGAAWRKKEDEGGVRRVDFLGDKYVFAGLVRTSFENVQEVKLLLKSGSAA